MKLLPLAKQEYRYIRGFRVGKGAKERYVLYTELKAMDPSGKSSHVLPTINMELAMKILMAGETKLKIFCHKLPLFGRNHLYLSHLVDRSIDEG